MSTHSFGKFDVEVADDIGQAAMEAMGDSYICGSQELTMETTSLVALLFEWCRDRLKHGSRPIPIQQALRVAEECMADPKGMGIEPR